MNNVDDPKEYESLSQEEKQAVQYWISKAIRPVEKNYEDAASSYGLKHDYERASNCYLTNGQFKGAMLAAGHPPINEAAQNWSFKITPTYDKRRLPHSVSSQIEVGQLPTFRVGLLTATDDEELQRLVSLTRQKA